MTLDKSATTLASPVKPFKATATFWHATMEWFNLFMIFAAVFAIVGMLIVITANLLQRVVVPAVLAGLFLLLAVAFLILQIWGMYTLTIEITERGIRHRVSFQEIVIDWDKIQSVKFEPWKKQVTFWLEGKLTRIHDFGLRPSDSATIKDAILEQVRARNITIK